MGAMLRRGPSEIALARAVDNGSTASPYTSNVAARVASAAGVLDGSLPARAGDHAGCLGRRLWQDCDGRRTVEEIVDRFRDEHRLTFHEARAAVSGYLQGLIQRGVLAIVMRDSS